MKIILHIDIDAFFTSASALQNPTLKNKPIAISSSGPRGVVSASSYAARKLGITAGMPNFKIPKISNKVILVEPNYNLYILLSWKFFELLKKNFSQKIEIISIDECYLDVTDVYQKWHSLKEMCFQIRALVLKELNLSVSIGISYNKFLAKMATNLGKPAGMELIRKSEIKAKIWPLAIETFYGIGKKTAPKLRGMDINKIGDLAIIEPEKIKAIFGINSYQIVNKANGISSDVLEIESDFKGISHSVTFKESNKNNEHEILIILKELAHNVIDRVTNDNLLGKVITVFIKDQNHKVTSKRKKQLVYTNNFDEIWNIILELFFNLWKGEYIRLVGFGLSDLKNKYTVNKQKSLFEIEEKQSLEAELIDVINFKYKKGVLTSAKKLAEKNAAKNKKTPLNRNELHKLFKD